MIIRKVDLDAVAAIPSQYPEKGFPEVALAGRSNVGKSSLINTMVSRKALARISGTPGKTRTINFYNINDELYLVDLPGYGYAKVSKVEKVKWGEMIEKYITNRVMLKLVIQLVDIRHEPTQDDKIMFQWMKATGSQAVVVATKADKLSKNQMFKNIAMIKKSLQLEKDDLFISFSSETKVGREELWEIIEKVCIGKKELE
ncbi:MAG: YihA family ribosome biosis GTP-binding protein [Clostridiales bacterium]|nr:YihA family ribosome biosis GTP-binding protein [Clostridiales bacterium]